MNDPIARPHKRLATLVGAGIAAMLSPSGKLISGAVAAGLGFAIVTQATTGEAPAAPTPRVTNPGDFVSLEPLFIPVASSGQIIPMMMTEGTPAAEPVRAAAMPAFKSVIPKIDIAAAPAAAQATVVAPPPSPQSPPPSITILPEPKLPVPPGPVPEPEPKPELTEGEAPAPKAPPPEELPPEEKELIITTLDKAPYIPDPSGFEPDSEPFILAPKLVADPGTNAIVPALVVTVPEPSTVALVMLGLAGFAWTGYRRSAKKPR